MTTTPPPVYFRALVVWDGNDRPSLGASTSAPTLADAINALRGHYEGTAEARVIGAVRWPPEPPPFAPGSTLRGLEG